MRYKNFCVYLIFLLILFLSNFDYSESTDKLEICSSEYSSLIIGQNISDILYNKTFYEETCTFSFKTKPKVNKIFSETLNLFILIFLIIFLVFGLIFIAIIIRKEFCKFNQIKNIVIIIIILILSLGLLGLYISIIILSTKIKFIKNETKCLFKDNDLILYNYLSEINDWESLFFNEDYNKVLNSYNLMFKNFENSLYNFSDINDEVITMNQIEDIDNEFKSNIQFYYNLLLNLKEHFIAFYKDMNNLYDNENLKYIKCYPQNQNEVSDIENNFNKFENKIKLLKILLYISLTLSMIFSLYYLYVIFLFMIAYDCKCDNKNMCEKCKSYYPNKFKKILLNDKTRALCSFTIISFILIFFLYMSTLFFNYFGKLPGKYKFSKYKIDKYIEDKISSFRNLNQIKDSYVGKNINNDLNIIQSYIIDDLINTNSFPIINKVISEIELLNISDSAEVQFELQDSLSNYYQWMDIVHNYLNNTFKSIVDNDDPIGIFYDDYLEIKNDKVNDISILCLAFGIVTTLFAYILIIYINGKDYMLKELKIIDIMYENKIDSENINIPKSLKTEREIYVNNINNINAVIMNRINKGIITSTK